MEQNNQQVSQKPSLPIKTKIAAWWMIIIGGGIVIFGLVLPPIVGPMFTSYETPIWDWDRSPQMIILALVFLIPSFLIFQRKRLGK